MILALSVLVFVAVLFVAPAFAEQGKVWQVYNGHGQWIKVDPAASQIHVQAAVSDTRAVASLALLLGKLALGILLLWGLIYLISLLCRQRNANNADNSTRAAVQNNIYIVQHSPVRQPEHNAPQDSQPAECVDEVARQMATDNRGRIRRVGRHLQGVHAHLRQHDEDVRTLAQFAAVTAENPTNAEYYRQQAAPLLEEVDRLAG